MSAPPPIDTASDTAYARGARRLDRVALASGSAVAWLIAPMVLSLCYEVVARYLFNAPTIWAYDMTFMLYGTFFMLGAAYTLQRKGHVRTDSLYAAWKPRRQALVDLGGYLVMFFPFVAVFAFVGWGYFVKAWSTNETFVSSAWQPITWPFKLAMPVAGVLLLLQGTSECLKCLHTLKTGRWPDRPSPEATEQPLTA
ncbi:MAG: TRAP transporter small permease subunit [Betaproteobacteria bacterium]|nr:TRAP transporter small permease subunit [Betaproteobacteria bacterium]MCC6246699.1 TRAP transporter small permease subunit [Rubrivivax sp.]MCL4697792.1 TRAP transporter small permease subunit [Burkholderiaceae bacterium]